jgi:hypothetical protein
VAYCGAMIWQFTQVSGSSERYDDAFEIYNVNIKIPKIAPNKIENIIRHDEELEFFFIFYSL